jgi:hypothetical protein
MNKVSVHKNQSNNAGKKTNKVPLIGGLQVEDLPAAELKCAGGGGGTGGPGAFSLLHSMVRCLRAGQKGSDV